MLSEAWQLAQALANANIPMPTVHQRVKSPGRTTGECLRVRLGPEGRVATLEHVVEDEWGGMWTIMEGKMSSFPVVRVKIPILKVPLDDGLWRDLGYDERGKHHAKVTTEQRFAALGNALAKFGASPKYDEDLWNRLRDDKAKELLECTVRNENAESKSLCMLAQRFQEATQNPAELLRQIADMALTQVRASRLDAYDAVETLLVGKKPTKEDETPKIAIQLAFDLDDSGVQTARVYCREMKNHVISLLPNVGGKSASPVTGTERTAGASDTCAITGRVGAIQEGAFPMVMFPVLNKEFPLFSMFEEAGCNRRYGLTASRVVPVSSEAALGMKASLEWLLDPSREGKTWRGVASGKFKKGKAGKKKTEEKDLLLVYVDGKPEVDAAVAGFFGAGEGDIEKQFEVDAGAVCQALIGVEQERPGSRLNLFLLRKASDGQAHVAIAETPSVNEILDAAARWQTAVRDNLPAVTLPLPPKAKGQEAIKGRPLAPYPDQVVTLLSQQWVREGKKKRDGDDTRANAVQGVGLGEVLNLLLRTSGKWESCARRMLTILLHNDAFLLVYVLGTVRTKPPKEWPPAASRRTALRAVSLLGILLDALGRRKEVYMQDAAFQIGRMLALADTLHKDYCVVVRKGSLPPSLIGNAMMPRAMDNPKLAVADLADRMRVYVGWAKVAAEPSDMGTEAEDKQRRIAVHEARKTLRRYQPLADRLHEIGLPDRCDDSMKAEMLLGYLASPKTSDEGEDSDNKGGKQ